DGKGNQIVIKAGHANGRLQRTIICLAVIATAVTADRAIDDRLDTGFFFENGLQNRVPVFCAVAPVINNNMADVKNFSPVGMMAVIKLYADFSGVELIEGVGRAVCALWIAVPG